MTTKQKVLIALYNNWSTGRIEKELGIARQLLRFHVKRSIKEGLFVPQPKYRFTTKGKQIVNSITLTKENK